MKKLTTKLMAVGVAAIATASALAIPLSSLLVPGATITVGDKTFGDFVFSTTCSITAAQINVNATRGVTDPSVYYLVFQGPMQASNGETCDIGLQYSVTATAPWKIDAIDQAFTLSGGAGSVLSIGETVWKNGFYNGFVAQSTVSYNAANPGLPKVDIEDPPGELLQGDLLGFAAESKLWVTKDVYLKAAAGAEVEEEEVKTIRAKQTSQFVEDDYGTLNISKPNQKQNARFDEFATLSNANKNKTSVSLKINEDLTRLSKEQRLKLIEIESPELIELSNELSTKSEELKEKVKMLKELQELKSHRPESDELIDFLEVKQQLILSYCTNIVFYLYLKSYGRTVSDHPVMKQLLFLRYAIEKLRPIEAKLKFQIDRLLLAADVSSGQADGVNLSFKPNPESILSNNIQPEADKLSNVYEVQRTMFYNEGDIDSKSFGGMKKKKSRQSLELIKELREEFGNAPEHVTSTGNSTSSKQKKALQEEQERMKYEEDRFVRLTISKKEKTRLQKLKNEGEGLDINELNTNFSIDDIITKSGEANVPYSIHEDNSLQNSANALSKRKQNSVSSASSDAVISGFENADELVREFGLMKESYNAAKKSRYEDRSSINTDTLEEIDEDSKRAISSEMMANRGLTPHRNKAKKNPRVKKRLAFDKAVKARKGQVREVQMAVGDGYAGEMTGIKASASRSRRL